MTDKAYYEKGFDIVSARERFFGKREMCERYVIRFLEDPNYEERSLCEPVTLADAGCSFRGS